jgi:hypothetical protein
MAALLVSTTTGVAVVVHGVFAPFVFAVLAWHYFRARGAREPLPTALAWVAIVGALDLAVVAPLILGNPRIAAGLVWSWLPLAGILLATWATGALMSTMPWSRPATPR